MMRRLALGLVLLGPFVLPLAPIDAQAPPSPAGAAATPRAIRRDVPLTNSIRRAYDAGTRDMTGRPGPNYWQLQTDYDDQRAGSIPPRRRSPGTETITRAQQQPAGADRDLVLRLDHNIFRGLVPRGMSVPAENTDGMVVTRLAVNGEAVDLTAPAAPAGRGRGAGGRAARFRCPDSTRRSRVSRSPRRSPAKSTGEARDRLAHEAARRHPTDAATA